MLCDNSWRSLSAASRICFCVFSETLGIFFESKAIRALSPYLSLPCFTSSINIIWNWCASLVPIRDSYISSVSTASSYISSSFSVNAGTEPPPLAKSSTFILYTERPFFSSIASRSSSFCLWFEWVGSSISTAIESHSWVIRKSTLWERIPSLTSVLSITKLLKSTCGKASFARSSPTVSTKIFL